jgi:cytochrome b involved in lipid metabolism
VINGKVYDVSKFAKVHPGGLGVLLAVGGQDCTKQFYALHQEQVLVRTASKFLIGHVEGQKVTEPEDKSTLILSNIYFSLAKFGALC